MQENNAQNPELKGDNGTNEEIKNQSTNPTEETVTNSDSESIPQTQNLDDTSANPTTEAETNIEEPESDSLETVSNSESEVENKEAENSESLTEEQIGRDAEETDSAASKETLVSETETEGSDSSENTPSDKAESEDASEVDEKEATMTEDSSSDLNNLLSEEDKPWIHIDSHGHLHLIQTDHYPTRKIAEVTESSLQTVLQTLRDQFQKAKEDIASLESKFKESEDKVKILPDVESMLLYLQKIDGLGDLPALIKQGEALLNEASKEVQQRVTKRKQIIDQFREFLNAEITSIKESDQKSKSFFDDWKSAGHLPQKENNELYDELKKLQDEYTVMRRDFLQKQDFEYMDNMDRKREIIRQAQEIASKDEWKNGHKQMQDLFDQWKKVGKVPRDQIQPLWDEFKAAKDTFYDRKQQFYDQLKSSQEENYTQRLSIVEQIENLKDSQNWNQTTKQILELDKAFSDYGPVPSDKMEELLDRLHTAKRYYFEKKDEFYKNLNENFEKNLIIKTDIANRAEAIKDSRKWKETSIKMNKLFDEWKASGPTFRSKDKIVWKQFIEARTHFYKQKDAYFNELNKSKFKENILKLDDEKENVKELQKYQAEDVETLEQLKKDFESESNDRFKSKIGETITVLEKQIAQSQKDLEAKLKWIDKTEKDIQKIEDQEENDATTEEEVTTTKESEKTIEKSESPKAQSEKDASQAEEASADTDTVESKKDDENESQEDETDSSAQETDN